MKKVLAVYDVDQAYGERLTDYLNRTEQVPFHMIYFTNKEVLIDYIKGKPIDVLLINQAAMCQEIKELNIEQVLFLTDVEGLTQIDEYQAIYKYQSTEYLVKELVDCYEAIVPPAIKNSASGRRIQIIGVYSPIKRCLKTSFCLALGQLLGQNKSVLYLNLEEFSGFENLLERSFPADLSDALFYYGQNNLRDQLPSLLQSLNDHMDFIPPIHYPEDREAVKEEEFLGFLEELIQYGEYDVLILDIADGFSALEGLLNLCHIIYMPVKEDPISMAKLQEFEKFIRIAGNTEVLKRIKKLKLPYYHGFGGKQAYLEQLLWGELGDYVRKLIEGTW